MNKKISKKDKAEIIRHISGESGQAITPFSNLDIPICDDNNDDKFYEKWVQPFYCANIACTANDKYFKNVKLVYPEIDFNTITLLLSQTNWYARISGAYLLSIKPIMNLDEHVGKLLLRSDYCFTGLAYSLALSQLNTDKSISFLVEYLSYYLTRFDLSYNQNSAFGALYYLDKINKTNYHISLLPKLDEFSKKHSNLYNLDKINSEFNLLIKTINGIRDFVNR